MGSKMSQESRNILEKHFGTKNLDDFLSLVYMRDLAETYVENTSYQRSVFVPSFQKALRQLFFEFSFMVAHILSEANTHTVMFGWNKMTGFLLLGNDNPLFLLHHPKRKSWMVVPVHMVREVDESDIDLFAFREKRINQTRSATTPTNEEWLFDAMRDVWSRYPPPR